MEPQTLSLCHLERSAATKLPISILTGAKSKDPEKVSTGVAASGSSLEECLTLALLVGDRLSQGCTLPPGRSRSRTGIAALQRTPCRSMADDAFSGSFDSAPV